MLTLDELMGNFPRQGVVEWIGIRQGRNQPMVQPDAIELDPAAGIVGDRYGGRSGRRQVTLIQWEHLVALASLTGRESVAPELLRRNIVVRGINLLALKDRRFHLGTALLEYTGLCHPCSRMEAVLGPGGYNAMRGHGGITARVVEAGRLSRGDGLRVLPGH